MRLCEKPGCHAKHHARGLCEPCYLRAYYRRRLPKSEAMPGNRLLHIRDMVPLGENIHGRRLSLGMTQRDLAEKAGVSEHTIIRVSKGLYEPRTGTLYALASALCCEAWELMKPRQYPLPEVW
jgi:DNA-binding XRE family transcriptional regulator